MCRKYCNETYVAQMMVDMTWLNKLYLLLCYAFQKRNQDLLVSLVIVLNECVMTHL